MVVVYNSSPMARHPHPPSNYAAFYCEENVWRMAVSVADADDRYVWLISNPQRQALCAWQRSGRTQSVLGVATEGVVVWDYHVVLASSATVWDLDTRLEMPCPIAHYLRATFPCRGQDTPAPMVRIVPAQRYVREFASDRRHMMDSRGQASQPLPSWPAIRGEGCTDAHTLPQLLSFTDPTFGPWFDIDQLVRHLQL
jgi:protein N-terminal glutamine amidohydrolase